MSKTDLTAARLRELLHYEPKTGVFTWRVARGPRAAGAEAGTLNKGYRFISIDYKLHAAHRLAWLWMTGEWPADEIDHWDTRADNNRWKNLREATSLLNKQNRRRAPKNKKSSPLLGAQWHGQRGRWRSSIRVSGRLRSLGFFETDVAAHRAYVKAKRQLHAGNTL